TLRRECGADPSTSCSDVSLFNKTESIVACKAIIGVWISNGFPVDEKIEGSNGRRHVLMEMRSGKEISLVTLESKIDAAEEKKGDQAITSFSIDSSSTHLIDRPLPTLISSPSSLQIPSSNNQVSLFAEELARQQQQQPLQQPVSTGILGYNWRLGADQQWKLAPVTQEDAQASAIIRNEQMMQSNGLNPMIPSMPSPLVPPLPSPIQSPMGSLPMSVGRPMGRSIHPMGGEMQPPEPSFPAAAWRTFNQVLDGFSTGFSSLADKVFKII
ncbi:hypothetical protein PMAYCL1PPCAC_29155, partial [Pristionchus mayeri]